jgi:hypothetical protein
VRLLRDLAGTAPEPHDVGLALRIRLGKPPFAGEAGRLWDERRRFSDLRHKAVHWLAPVPPERAGELLDYYRRVLHAVVPLVVTRVEEQSVGAPADSAARRSAHRTTERARALLEAADGSIPASYRPLPFDQARAAASTAAGGGTAAEA